MDEQLPTKNLGSMAKVVPVVCKVMHEHRPRKSKSLPLSCQRKNRKLFAAHMSESGLAGESSKVKLLYLAVTSRILDKPLSLGVKGPSSAGKSHIVDRVLRHFPEDADSTKPSRKLAENCAPVASSALPA